MLSILLKKLYNYFLKKIHHICFKRSQIRLWHSHCVKSVGIRCFSGPHFPEFRLNMKRYSVPPRIQSECGKIRTRKTPNTDTLLAVLYFKSFVSR